MYLGQGGDRERESSALTLRCICREASEASKEFASVLIPVVFYAMHDPDKATSDVSLCLCIVGVLTTDLVTTSTSASAGMSWARLLAL